MNNHLFSHYICYHSLSVNDIGDKGVEHISNAIKQDQVLQ